MSLSIQKCIDFSKKFLLKSLLHTDKKTHIILPATSHKHTFQGKIAEKKVIIQIKVLFCVPKCIKSCFADYLILTHNYLSLALYNKNSGQEIEKTRRKEMGQTKLPNSFAP